MQKPAAKTPPSKYDMSAIRASEDFNEKVFIDKISARAC
jgi:hypothetical protein